MNEKKISFLDIVLLLVKGKKFIIIFTIVMSLIAVTYSLVVTEKWSSEVTVLPITDQGALSMAKSLMEGLGLGSSTSPKASTLKYSAILNSRSITENTIRKFNLIDYFEITDSDSLKAMDKAIRRFHGEMFDILVNDEVHFMTIRLTTKDKYFSREISQHYLNVLLSYAQNNSNNLGRQKRELLETRINQITDEMLNLTSEIKEYQKEHNIIEIEQQAKASIEGYSSILKELFSVELELSYAEKFMTNSLKHRDLADQKKVIIQTLKKLENTNDEMPFFLALKNINDSFFSIQEKVFALEIYKKILETIYPQFELARIEEIDNMDKLEIIDYPNLPGRRAFPKRAMICVATFIVSFLFSSSLVLLNKLTSEQDKIKVKEIWNNLFH